MAGYTVMDFSGLTQPLNNLANIFTQGPELAVKADQARIARDKTIQETTNLAQRHAFGEDALRQAELRRQLLQNPDMRSVGGRGALAASGITLNPDTLALNENPANTLGEIGVVDPEAYTPYQQSSAIALNGLQPWQNTQAGVQQSQMFDLAQKALAGLTGSAGGSSSVTPVPESPEEVAALDADIDAQINAMTPERGMGQMLFGGGGTVVDPAVKYAIRSIASDAIRNGVSRGAAVRYAIDALGVNRKETGNAFPFEMFPNYRIEAGKTPEQAGAYNPILQGSTSARASAGNTAIQQLLSQIFGGPDTGGIGMGPTPGSPAAQGGGGFAPQPAAPNLPPAVQNMRPGPNGEVVTTNPDGTTVPVTDATTFTSPSTGQVFQRDPATGALVRIQ